MNINCINNKIANANNALKPIILQAIKDIYLNGNNQMTARMVKNQCIVLDANILWGKKIPAICNSMRISIECSGSIVGEDRDFNEFTIAFDLNVNNNLYKSKNNTNPKAPKVDSLINNKKPINKKNNRKEADKKIDEKKGELDWDKIKDKRQKKLLIIGCSHTKTQGGTNVLEYDYFNNGNHINLISMRNTRKTLQYVSLLLNARNYFENINRGNADYFNFQYNIPLYKSAIERYFGGKFYSEELLQLYRRKNDNSNLHILIISGLYGIIEFRDSIIDYHLEIKRKPFWTNDNNTSIHDAVKKYIKENEIANEMVFYSLSNSGNYCYTIALKPSENWNDIWINHDRGDTSARFLKDYFLPEL